MSQDNQISLRGWVAVEPKFFMTTQAHAEIAELRLGSTSRWLNRTTGEWQESEPSYYTVKCWRKLALNVKASLHKGDRILVRGKFSTRIWTDGQQRRREDIEIEADSIGHDLVYGVSIFNRVQPARNVPEALANGEMARAGLESAEGPGADELPPLPGESAGYGQDGYVLDGEAEAEYAAGDEGDPFAAGDTLEARNPDEEAALVGAGTENEAALPF